MQHSIFYSNHQSDQHIASDSPQMMEASEICRRLSEFLLKSPDFLGLVDPLGTVLQFAIEDDFVWMEIPVPKKQGSYGKRIPHAQVEQTIRDLGEYFTPDRFEGLEFQEWSF